MFTNLKKWVQTAVDHSSQLLDDGLLAQSSNKNLIYPNEMDTMINSRAKFGRNSISSLNFSNLTNILTNKISNDNNNNDDNTNFSNRNEFVNENDLSTKNNYINNHSKSRSISAFENSNYFNSKALYGSRNSVQFSDLNTDDTNQVDLSHLSADEKAKIELVLRRAKEDEDKKEIGNQQEVNLTQQSNRYVVNSNSQNVSNKSKTSKSQNTNKTKPIDGYLNNEASLTINKNFNQDNISSNNMHEKQLKNANNNSFNRQNKSNNRISNQKYNNNNNNNYLINEDDCSKDNNNLVIVCQFCNKSILKNKTVQNNHDNNNNNNNRKKNLMLCDQCFLRKRVKKVANHENEIFDKISSLPLSSFSSALNDNNNNNNNSSTNNKIINYFDNDDAYIDENNDFIEEINISNLDENSNKNNYDKNVRNNNTDKNDKIKRKQHLNEFMINNNNNDHNNSNSNNSIKNKNKNVISDAEINHTDHSCSNNSMNVINNLNCENNSINNDNTNNVVINITLNGKNEEIMENSINTFNNKDLSNSILEESNTKFLDNQISSNSFKNKPKRMLPSTPSSIEMSCNNNLVESSYRNSSHKSSNSSLHTSPYSSNISISDLNPTNSNDAYSNSANDILINLNKQLENLNRDIELPKNNLNEIDTSFTATNKKVSPSSFGNHENVAEWLRKSSDTKSANLLSIDASSIANNNKSRSTNELSVMPSKQYRSNSIAMVRIIPDEPLIEINLNKQFYLKRSQKLSMEENSQNFDSVNTHLKSNLNYTYFSKSQSGLTSNDYNEKNRNMELKTDPSIQKILIYKDPKELNSYKSDSTDNLHNKSRRPSASLGIQIAACQPLPELDQRNLAALVSAVDPNGLVEQFNVDIKQGDEIMEINGINLRNKKEDQIESILNNSCQLNNGEIELVVRRSSISSNKSLNENNANIKEESAYQSHKNSIMSEELMSTTSSSELQDTVNEYIHNNGNNMNNNRSSILGTPSSETNERFSIASSTSPISNNDLLISNNTNNNSAKKVNTKNQNSISSSISATSSSYSAFSSSNSYNSQNKHLNNNNNNNTFQQHLDYIDENNSNQNYYNTINKNERQRSTNPPHLSKVTCLREGQGFREISIKRKVGPNKRDMLITDPALLFALNRREKQNRSQNLNNQQDLNNYNQIKGRNFRKFSETSEEQIINRNDNSYHNEEFDTINDINFHYDKKKSNSISSTTNLNFKNFHPSEKSSVKIKLNNMNNIEADNDLNINSKLEKTTSYKLNTSNSNVTEFSSETTNSDLLINNGQKYSKDKDENSKILIDKTNNDKDKSIIRRKLSYCGPVSNNESILLAKDNETDYSLSEHSSRRNSKDTTANQNITINPMNFLNVNSYNNEDPFNLNNKKKQQQLNVSQESILADEFNSNTPLGDIQIQLAHKEEDHQLIIKILKARNLVAKDTNGFSDPFVKVYLLPGRDQENKRRTKYVTKSLNPEWNSTVVYSNVFKEELDYKTLEFTVWDWDRFKSNDFLGIVNINLKDCAFLDDKPRWYKLKHALIEDNDETKPGPKETSKSSSFKKSFKKKANN